jgi:hypothetical protein
MRKAIAGGVTLAGALRRPAASQPRIGHAVVRNADVCPARRLEPLARRPHTAAPAAPAQPHRTGWLARFHRSSPQPAPCSHGQFAADNNAPFTLEEFPGLLPEACAFFNTPLEDLDPEILPCLLAAFAESVAALLPPELGMTDPQELFSDLWDHFGAPLYGPMPDVFTDKQQNAPFAAPVKASPAEQIVSPHKPPQPPSALSMISPDPLTQASPVAPDPLTQASPAAPAQALPAMPLVSRDPCPESLPPAPAGTLAHTSFIAPPSLADAEAAEQSHHAPITAAAWESAAPAASMPRPVSRGDGSVLPCGHALLDRIASTCHRCRKFFRRALFRRSLLQPLPSRHWCYAARASPCCV